MNKIETDEAALERRLEEDDCERAAKYEIERLEALADGALSDGSPCGCDYDCALMTWNELTSCAEHGHRAALREMRRRLTEILGSDGRLYVDEDPAVGGLR